MLRVLRLFGEGPLLDDERLCRVGLREDLVEYERQLEEEEGLRERLFVGLESSRRDL